MQQPKDTILDPFEPVIGLGANWQDETALVRVRDAKRRLQRAEEEQTESIHQTLRHEFPTIVEQYRNALAVQERLGKTAEGIQGLQKGMQEIEALTTPLVKHLSTRSLLLTQNQTATHHLATLQSLQTRLQTLENAESQLEACQAETSGLLALLDPTQIEAEHGVGVLERTRIRAVLDPRKGMIKQAAAAQLQEAFERAFFVDTSPLPSGSSEKTGKDAAAAMRNTDADEGWDLDEDSLMVDDDDYNNDGKENEEKLLARMQVVRRIPLRVVTLNQANSKQRHQLHSTPIATTTLLTSLHSLNLLQPLLSALQTRIIKHFIRPLVDSFATSPEQPRRRLAVRYTRAEGEGGGEWNGAIELFTGAPQMEVEEGGEDQLWRSLTVLFEALREGLSPPPPLAPSSSSSSNETTATTTALVSFHKHLVAETLHIVLDSFLLRSLPLPLPAGATSESAMEERQEDDEGHTVASASLLALRGWVETLHRAQEFEETLLSATTSPQAVEQAAASGTHHNHNHAVIREFVEARAGAAFAAGRKRCVLGSVRALVLPSDESTGMKTGVAASGGWGRWQSRLVVRERIIHPPPPAMAEPRRKEAASDTPLERIPLAKGTGKDVAELQEGGWGFKDVIDLTRDESEEPASGKEKETGDDVAAEEDGWGFDDEDSIVRDGDAITSKAASSSSLSIEEPTSVPTTTEIIAPKPIRQARKIGKKGKSVVGAVASSDGGSATGTPLLAVSPSVDDVAGGRFGGSPAFGTPGAALRTDVSAPASGSAARPVAAARQVDGGEDGWNMEWEAESRLPVAVPQSEQAPQGPTVVREQLRVSVVLDTVVRIVKDELTFMAALQNNEIPSPSFHSLPATLASIPAETLELVRALVPVLYEAQIRDVPALAIQFANDCSWLAEQVRNVSEDMKRQGVLVDGLKRQAEKLVSLSTIVFDKQIDAQLDGIADTLMDLDGLEATSDDRKFQACTKAFQDVEHKLETLFRVYRDVMPESTCLESMGRLIDAAISQICTDILAVVDITAEESERLKRLCQILRPIEERFNEMNVNIVAFVPHWLRFCYLAEIMEASLVDITYLLESGALVDFTSDELVHLLLALFTDTPNRAELINKVMSQTKT